MKKLLLLPYIFFTLTLTVYAQGGVSTDGVLEIKTTTNTARAKLVRPLKLSATSFGLDFGSIVMVTNVGGTVILAAQSGSSARSFQSDVNLSQVSTTVGQGTAALFEFTGEGELAYAINLPTSDVTVTKTEDGIAITGANDSQEMVIKDFTYKVISNSSTSNTSAQVIPTIGQESFYVGASLNVSSGQEKGIYLGTYEVNIEYQ